MHLTEVARPRLLHVSLLCFVACGGAEEQEPAVQLVEAADTLISTADGFLGNPVDVAVASDGRVWIADPQNHRLAVWNPADGSVDTVGREGDGPGELQDPVALAVAGGSILAMQPQAGRLTEFSASGEYVASRIVPAGLMVPLYLSADSTAVSPSLGFNGSVVVLADLRSDSRSFLGAALAERPSMMSMTSLRDQALRKEFPVEFRNNVVAVTREGTVWVASQFTGDIVRLDANGDTLWHGQIPQPLVQAAHDAYFAAVESDPQRIHVPQLITDAEVVNGMLVISVRSESGTELWSYDAESGQRQGQLVIPGIAGGAFAVDTQRRRTYIAVPNQAMLVAVTAVPIGTE